MKLTRFLPLFALFLIWMAPLPLLDASPVIDSLSPNHGPVAGGNTVDLIGSGFTGATSVQFGTVTIPAGSFISISDTLISVTAPTALLSTVTVSVIAPSGTSPVSAGSYYAYQGNWIAYVTNGTISANLTPIDTSTNLIGTPIPCGASPLGVAITPDGSTIYVCNPSSNTVTPITAAGTGAPISSVGFGPANIAITPDGTRAYAACKATNSIIPINLATNTAGTAIPIESNGSDVAITPDGTIAYASNPASNDVTPITISTNTPGTSIPVGGSPQGIAITPDGKTAYIVNNGTSNLTPVAIPSNVAGTPIPIGSAPLAIAIVPDGTIGYVTLTGFPSGVTPFAITAPPSGPTISSYTSPNSIAITPDGKTAYVSDSTGSFVKPFSVPLNIAGSNIVLAQSPKYIAISPDPAPIAFFITQVSPPGSETFFDASSSVSSVGSIVSYAWDFGDGRTETNTTPDASHIYTGPGTYTVTLTVTNSAGTSTTQVFTGHTMSRNGGPSATATQSIGVFFLPSITSISPNTGRIAGGTAVSINGIGFTGATEVRFGSTTLPSSAFTVVSDSLITTTSPPRYGLTPTTSGNTLIVDVSVTTPVGTSEFTPDDQFTYFYPVPVVSGLSPSSGPMSGGTTVDITGPIGATGANFAGTTSVKFGAVEAVFSVQNNHHITAISPPGTGIVNVTVTTPGGTSALVPADQFTYTPINPPTVTSVTPSSGPTSGGTVVKLTGTGFGSATQVLFGSATAVFSINSDTGIAAIAPPGTGTVHVHVVNPAGTSASSTANQYTYTAAPSNVPVVTSISPTSGSVLGGTSVTVHGSSFTGATEVRFGPYPATSFTVHSDTSITATSPPGKGTVDVRVTTPNGTSPFTNADLFTYTYTLPDVTSISPSSGPTTGGTTVIINGTGFTGATKVLFGLASATFSVNSDIQITAIAPPGTGTVIISVMNPAGTFSKVIAANQYTYTTSPVKTPVVTSVSPNSGPAAGGTTVTITGAEFTGATEVRFGAKLTDSFIVHSNTSITATSPPGSGKVDVSVTTPNGTSAFTPADQFTYTTPPVLTPTITSVNPPSGPTSGGTLVALTGTNFTGAIEVLFGQTAATNFTVNSSTSITVTSPPGTGTVNVRVTTPNGTSPVVPADQFTYTTLPVLAPAITSVNPPSGPVSGGTVVSLTGTNFAGATEVRFGLTVATNYTVNSSTSITVTSPPGTGTVNVTVTTPHGTSPVVPADQFTYIASPVLAPTITSVSPPSGPAKGGTIVTLTGTHFNGATEVRFGKQVASNFTVNSGTSITVTSPPGSGTVNVRVTTPNGTSAVVPADQFTYVSQVAPPSHFRSKIIKRRSCHCCEYLIELKWKPSPGPAVFGYRLYRDGELIAVIPACGPHHYDDTCVKEHVHYTYKLVAFTETNRESKPLILVAPHKSDKDKHSGSGRK